MPYEKRDGTLGNLAISGNGLNSTVAGRRSELVETCSVCGMPLDKLGAGIEATDKSSFVKPILDKSVKILSINEYFSYFHS